MGLEPVGRSELDLVVDGNHVAAFDAGVARRDFDLTGIVVAFLLEVIYLTLAVGVPRRRRQRGGSLVGGDKQRL